MRYSLTSDVETQHVFIAHNCDVLDDSDTEDTYCTIWKSAFNKACDFAYVCTSKPTNASVGYVSELVESRVHAGSYCMEAYQVNMNETVESEIARLKSYICSRFGNIENFKIWQTMGSGDKFNKMEDVSTKTKHKIETRRHDTDDVYRFVVWLLTGQMPSYKDAIEWREGETWQETGRPSFLEAAKLPRNPDKGSYQIGHAEHGVTCQQFSNGKLVLTGLTPQALERWNHYKMLTATRWPSNK